MLIDLIPKMIGLFNEFMLEYSKKLKECSNNTDETMKLHTEMISIYAIKAIQLAVENLGDVKKEIDWDEWLKEHGVSKEEKNEN